MKNHVLMIAALVALFLFSAFPINAQQVHTWTINSQTVYSWIDEEGVTNISDRHPTQRAPKQRISFVQQRPASTPSNPAEAVVRGTIDRGLVQKAEVHDLAVSVYVRPPFHSLDYDDKRSICAAFLIWGKDKKGPSGKTPEFVMLYDSRDRRNIGNYEPRLGLRLKR